MHTSKATTGSRRPWNWASMNGHGGPSKGPQRPLAFLSGLITSYKDSIHGCEDFGFPVATDQAYLGPQAWGQGRI